MAILLVDLQRGGGHSTLRRAAKRVQSARMILLSCVDLARNNKAAYRGLNRARMYSRVIRAMFEMEISFGQTASHSPSFEQLPNPSLSACAIIAVTRVTRSGCPCGSSASCEIFALMKRCAEAFLQAATHAPQPMHAAESIAVSATSFGMSTVLPSGAPPTFTET